MIFKLIKSALLTGRNIFIFILAYVLLNIFQTSISTLTLGFIPKIIPLYLVAATIYLIFCVQTLFTKEFHEKFNKKQLKNFVKEQNTKVRKLSEETRRYLSVEHVQKLRKVLNYKDDILTSYVKGEQSFLKEKVLEKTLNLIISYMNLLRNYSIRSKDIQKSKIDEVKNRLIENKRKVDFAKDPVTQENIKNSIEMDEKVLERIKNEKAELERIGSKLDYMESTISALKHQMLSTIESEEIIGKLDEVLNEAVALESAISETRRGKMKSI